ncbi:hypothetical protein FRB91_000183 [Serendipita sp. 411]|nr:hypothetical protein FRB91_000183 [Serendipita sp. 411]
MVNWMDPVIMGVCNEIFKSIAHVSIGAYLWEAFSSIGFEWSLLRRKRGFKWPMLLYFYCKWMLVAAFVGMLIALNIHTKINCQALYNFNQFAGNSTLGASSTLLMLRSIAIWQRNRYISLFFVVVGLGLWGILMHGVTTVRAHWSPELNTCAVDAVTGVYLSLVYLYTMFTDLVVLIVTLAGLSWSPGKSGLWRMLWEQGIMFFIVAFIANLIPAVMLLVNLNPVINIMFSIPAIAATATCACRCFVGLSEYARKGDDMSAAIHTSPGTAGGWTHRIQGPMKRTGNTVQFRKTGDDLTPQPGASFNGYSLNGGYNLNGGSRFEPGPTDTIDVIMRSMGGGIPGQRYQRQGRYDDEEAIFGMNDLDLSPIKDDGVSDDTLSITPVDSRGPTTITPAAATTVTATRTRASLAAAAGTTMTQQMEARRPSIPIILSPPGSRRPSAVEVDLSQARQRAHHRGEDSV